MSNLILTHPQKTLIDSVLLQNISSRQKAKILAEKYGIKISHSVLAKYHTNYLKGEIDISSDSDNDSDNDSEAGTPLNLDLGEINELADALNKDENFSNGILKREFSELLALQIAITKDALKKHIAGLARYPTEYIRNLNIISNLLTK